MGEGEHLGKTLNIPNCDWPGLLGENNFRCRPVSGFPSLPPQRPPRPQTPGPPPHLRGPIRSDPGSAGRRAALLWALPSTGLPRGGPAGSTTTAAAGGGGPSARGRWAGAAAGWGCGPEGGGAALERPCRQTRPTSALPRLQVRVSVGEKGAGFLGTANAGSGGSLEGIGTNSVGF